MSVETPRRLGVTAIITASYGKKTNQLASGLFEIGAHVKKLTGSGSSILDFLVKHNVDGHAFAKPATDVIAQAGIIMKAMKDTNFSGSDENNARKFEIWFAQLLSAANGFLFLLMLIMNCRGHPYGTDMDGETVLPLWPIQYELEMYSEATRVLQQQPHYPYPLWMKNKIHTADGSASRTSQMRRRRLLQPLQTWEKELQEQRQLIRVEL
jgi:hypothetical protein